MKKYAWLLLPFLLLSCAREISVDNPQGFARFSVRDQYAATSPEGMIYRVRLTRNSPQQTLAFWAEALSTHLKKQGYVQAGSDSAFTAGKVSGLFSEWTVPYGGETYKYLTGVLVTREAVAVAEASGEHSIFARHRPAILESLDTIDFEGVAPPKLAAARGLPALGASREATPPARPADAAGKAQEPSSRGCLLQGTGVLSEDGPAPIEAVWPGTRVPAYDPASGSWSEQEVMRTISLEYRGDVVTLSVAGETVRVTGNHVFLVASGPQLARRPPPEELSASERAVSGAGRWVEARHLRAGDRLVAIDGSQPAIDSLSLAFTTTQVHHLAVAGPHTYAVEGAGLVVHNGGAAEKAKAPVESDRAAREREVLAAAPTSFLPKEDRNERVRVYSGACVVKLDSVEEAKRQISAMAQKVGGYVEQSSDNGIVIRVPAAVFRAVFEEVLVLGEVLYRAIETYDVTDKFTDPRGRLAVAIKARDRLYALLARGRNVKERLEILQKIREYTDTIERLELSLQVLEQRIAMSRITVELRPRLEEAQTAEKPIPFAWIERLRPFYTSTSDLGRNASVALPDDVAVLQEKGALRAEAADGTSVRVGTTANDPRGDSAFWQQALLTHLKPRYQKAEAVDADPLKAVLFTSRDRQPFLYLVAAMPLKSRPTLVVFEAYFPDEAARARHMDGLLASFRKVQLR